MLVIHKIFLIVSFFNRIFCNKGLKAKISCFFCLTPLRLEYSRMRKTTWFLTSHRLKKIQKSASMELQEWSENVVYVEIHHFLKGNCKFFQLSECVMKTVNWLVCSITLHPYSITFYSLFLPFFVLEIFKCKYDKFFIRHSASIFKFEWFEQPCNRHLVIVGFF